MARIVVIGSGISGLTAALLLKRQGYEVVILEKQQQPGGALHRFQRQGVFFDVGFHYTGGLGEDEILRTLWRYCKVERHINVLPFPSSAADVARVDGLPGPVNAFFSYNRFAEELFHVFPREKVGIEQFFRVIRQRGASIPFYNMDRSLIPFLRKLVFPEQQSLGQLLRACTTNSQLQAILSLPVFLHGVQPDNIGLTLHASVAHSVYSGMYTVDCGGQKIVDAFLRVLEGEGVRILTGTSAETILTENDCVAGVRTAKGDIAATNVIYTGHPSFLPDMVPSSMLRRAYRNRLLNLRNTGSMFIVFGAVKENSYNDALNWNNYYSLPAGLNIPAVHPANPEGCFFLSGCGLRDITYPGKPDKEKAVILIRPASWQEASRFDGGSGKRGRGYRAWKQKESEKLVTAVNSNWNGLLDNFRVICTGSSLTFRDELDYIQGSVYGVRHSLNQYAVGARTRLPGLWLSGQSTLMPGILGASLSALVTVGGITGLESLWQEVRKCT